MPPVTNSPSQFNQGGATVHERAQTSSVNTGPAVIPPPAKSTIENALTSGKAAIESAASSTTEIFKRDVQPAASRLGQSIAASYNKYIDPLVTDIGAGYTKHVAPHVTAGVNWVKATAVGKMVSDLVSFKLPDWKNNHGYGAAKEFDYGYELKKASPPAKTSDQ